MASISTLSAKPTSVPSWIWPTAEAKSSSDLSYAHLMVTSHVPVVDALNAIPAKECHAVDLVARRLAMLFTLLRTGLR
jgi:hypothetical protein